MKKIVLVLIVLLGILSPVFSQALITDNVEGSYYLTTPEAISFATISFLPNVRITDAIRSTIETKNPGSKLIIAGNIRIISMGVEKAVTDSTYSMFSYDKALLLGLGQTVYYLTPIHQEGVEFMLVNVGDNSVVFLTSIQGNGQ